MMQIDAKNPVFGLEIEVDPIRVKYEGLDLEKIITGLESYIKSIGMIEKSEETTPNHLLYITNGSNKGLAHIMIITDELRKQEWFRNVCTKLDLWVSDREDINRLLFDGSLLEEYKARNMWG